MGQSKLFSAESCKNIKAAHEYIIKTNSLPDDCTPSFGNGVYWIQNMQVRMQLDMYRYVAIYAVSYPVYQKPYNFMWLHIASHKLATLVTTNL